MEDLMHLFERDAMTIFKEPWFRRLDECRQRMFLVVGLGNEVGEVLQIFKKALVPGGSIDREHLKEELGDVLWHMAVIANSHGILMDDIMEFTINKFRKRYPDRFKEEGIDDTSTGRAG